MKSMNVSRKAIDVEEAMKSKNGYRVIENLRVVRFSEWLIS
jgi:hypothetical protein